MFTYVFAYANTRVRVVCNITQACKTALQTISLPIYILTTALIKHRDTKTFFVLFYKRFWEVNSTSNVFIHILISFPTRQAQTCLLIIRNTFSPLGVLLKVVS